MNKLTHPKKEEVKNAATPPSPEPNTVPIIVGAQATILPTYDPYPRWLDHSGLPPAARIVYRVIYYRAISLSINNHGQYSNDQGHIFVIYPNDDLAKDCAVTLSAVKAAKKILKTREYISTEKIKGSNAIRIYPHYPQSAKTYYQKSLSQNSAKLHNSSSWNEFEEAAFKHSLGEEGYANFCGIGHSQT